MHLLPRLNLPIEELGLSLRVLRTLRRVDIKTIGDLIFRRRQLGVVRGLGPLALAEIDTKLGEFWGQQSWSGG
jgi:DNA-directed RNA polymerase alpha subunit